MEIDIEKCCRHGMVEAWCVLGECGRKKGYSGNGNNGSNGPNGLGINGTNGYKKFKFEDSPEFYFTIGYLARHADISVELLITNRDRFFDEYKRSRGHDPDSINIHIITCSRTWGDKYSVCCDCCSSLELETGNITQNQIGNRILANSIDFVWWLLKRGFELGRNHNIEEIRSNISDEYMEYYEMGLME